MPTHFGHNVLPPPRPTQLVRPQHEESIVYSHNTHGPEPVFSQFAGRCFGMGDEEENYGLRSGALWA
jgi:hypothetical protein